jgi:MSHA biogenesis protein MshN
LPETGESRVEQRARPPTPARVAERAYREALRHHELGRWAAARERLRAALEEAPNHRGARLALGTLFAQTGELAEAKNLLAAGLEASPDHAPFVMLQARILVEMQELEAAIAVLERGIPPLREDPEAHAFLAALYQRQAKHGRAARLYRDVLRLDSQRGVWWLGLGISLEALGKPGEALAAYRGAREVGRLDPPTRRYLEERIEALSRGSG